MQVKPIEMYKEPKLGGLRDRLVIVLELEEAFYNGDDKDIEEVVFVMKPKTLTPQYRSEVEWK